MFFFIIIRAEVKGSDSPGKTFATTVFGLSGLFSVSLPLIVRRAVSFVHAFPNVPQLSRMKKETERRHWEKTAFYAKLQFVVAQGLNAL